jgi:uncharacterized protein (TIGR00369 family)
VSEAAAAPPAQGAQAALPDIPEGYKPLRSGGGFIAANGPLYVRRDEAVGVKVGFRVEPRHCNPMGVCHGGWLATFADMLLPISAHAQSELLRRRFLPTISLQLDYIAPANVGDWVEGEGQLLKVTRAMVFMQGLVRTGDGVLLRCSGVFKIGPEFPPGWNAAAAASTTAP